jgi:hypothetical protein
MHMSILLARPKLSARLRRRIALLGCLAAGGCFETHVDPRDAASDDGQGDAQRTPEPPGESGDDPVDGGLVTPEDDAAVTCRTPDVDMLFVIDNSGSMAEEQQKLTRALPQLLGVLATGNHDGKRRAEGEPTDFSPARTMHVGVVSTDLGINLAPHIESCGGASYSASAPDPANPDAVVRSMPENGVRRDKPFGDDGVLQTSTAVAEAGIWARAFGTTFSTPVELVVAPDPTCADVRPAEQYLTYEPGDRFEDTQHAFTCIAKLGKNGCGLEQQLESMLKALSPSSVAFSRGSHGHGDGDNAGFLRDDAVLVVVIVSDEEDCSIPDGSSELFNRNSTSFSPGTINTRCGKPENQRFLHGISRYVDGLRALKSEANQGRIVVASISGMPLARNVGGKPALQGEEIAGLLGRPDMQFMVRASTLSASEEEPSPVCVSARGDGSAAPGRRFLQVARAFGDNGIAASICEDDYGGVVELLGQRIARHLGDCE